MKKKRKKIGSTALDEPTGLEEKILFLALRKG